MEDLRAALAITVLLAVPLSGCIGFDGPEMTCSDQHAYADRLAFEQDGLYAAMGEAAEEAARQGSASSQTHPEGSWEGTRGEIETVRVDGRVHGAFIASPQEDPSLRVHDSMLAGYGSLQLDRIDWSPNGSQAEQITYRAPADAGGEHTLSMAFSTANTTEAAAAEQVRTLHDALFPDDPYEPLDDETFSRAWLGTYELTPRPPVHADGFVTSLIDAGDLLHRQAPFQDLAFPHTLGLVHLQGEDVGPYDGQLEVSLAHDVRAIANGTDPTLVLEATPADRAYVSNLGSAALGADDLRIAAHEQIGSIDGLPTLALAEATYETGGQGTVPSGGECTTMQALGEPLTGAPD